VLFLRTIILLLLLLFLLDFGLRGHLWGIVLGDNDIRRRVLIRLFFVRAVMLTLHVFLVIIVLLNLRMLPLRLGFRSDH
jgi:hypothetical protein